MDHFEVPYHLDDYEECKSISLQSLEVGVKYCLADVQIKNNFSKFKTIAWGLCLPATADGEYVNKSLREVLDGRLKSKYEIVFNEDLCQFPNKDIYGIDFYAIIFLQLVLFATVIFSTLHLRINKHTQTRKETLLMGIIKSFDVKTNAIKLMEVTANDVKVLHSMRFISAFIIVHFHVYVFYIIHDAIKDSDLDRDPEHMHLALVYHTHVMVDTFFMISGLLLSRSLLSNVKKPVNVLKLIVKRYFRLMGSFINALLVSLLILKNSNEGPFSVIYSLKEGERCNKYWWRNILMIENYVDTTNICFAVSWSIPSDFHFTIVGALLLWLYQRNRRAAVQTFAVLFTSSIVLPGAVTFAKRLIHEPLLDYDSIANFRYTWLSMPTYVSSHLRIGPYLVGIALGYIISLYKPTNFRNVISKKASIIGFLLILTVGLTILYIMELLHQQPYNVLKVSVMAALYRTVWALAMAALVIICEYGNLPLVTSFLNCSIFVPLSRLSYGVYLTNLILIFWEVISIQNPMQFDRVYVFKRSCVITMACIIFSFIQWFYVEAPLNNFIGFLLRRREATTKHNNLTDMDTDGQRLTNGYKKVS